MVKTSLKNFFKNLLYLFIPMGIFYLFLLLAVFVLAKTAFVDVKNTVSSLVALVSSSVDESSASVQDFWAYAVAQVDWNGNFLDTLRTIIDTNWVSNTIRGFFDTISSTTEGFDDKLNAIIGDFANHIIVDIVVAVVICGIGLWLANFATRFALRTKVARRNIKQVIVSRTVVPIVQTLLMIGAIWLIGTIQLYSVLVIIAIVVLYCVMAICTSYLIYRDKSLKFRDVLSARNVLMQIATAGIILAIDVVIGVAFFYVDALIAVLLMIPVVIYSANIVDVNTDSYVRELVQSKTAASTPESATEEAAKPQKSKAK